jgi:hypothetical protein
VAPRYENSFQAHKFEQSSTKLFYIQEWNYLQGDARGQFFTGGWAEYLSLSRKWRLQLFSS